MSDDVPPLLPEIAAWAIVAVDDVGPSRESGRPGRSLRKVTRADGSQQEVIYDAAIDRRESPELAIAERWNLLVMKGDLRVLDPQVDGEPVEIR